MVERELVGFPLCLYYCCSSPEVVPLLVVQHELAGTRTYCFSVVLAFSWRSMKYSARMRYGEYHVDLVFFVLLEWKSDCENRPLVVMGQTGKYSDSRLHFELSELVSLELKTSLLLLSRVLAGFRINTVSSSLRLDAQLELVCVYP